MKYAIIDIGSNTMRLSVYRVSEEGFSNLFSKKLMAGLAGYIKNRAMTKRGISRACETLLEFKSLLESFDIDRTCVFATASLRNISNTDDVVREIARQTDYAVEVISGYEEAMLDYYGALRSVPLSSGVLVDIGGGSTEVVSFGYGEESFAVSLSVGSLNLYSRHVSKFLPKPSEQKAILCEVMSAVREAGVDRLPKSRDICGVGGTARAAMKLVNALYGQDRSNRVITRMQERELYDILTERGKRARSLILKNCPDRVHTILPGMMALHTLTELFDADRITVSQYGVREGYLCRKIINPMQNADK